ncbi:hypothetical protein HDF19_12575 [Mucilaginibacter sp. E4BP6]|uniref:hypothetical protein n=1 Tax=Mucilaginibacter sp. E4BP6 TaxID=2723089 RepID=UPI0015CCE958|nr:hypothetical protein [Mucilaginibacter sp. E4BP6]NYE64998.1 hypothetical protein [Mucilaginibacter sp. E4BP6]
MTKKLLKTLFTTFIISTVLNIAITCIYYSATQKNSGYDYKTMLQMIASGAFLLNIILLLMVLPVLFFSLPHIRSSMPMRILLYFAGPVVFLITASLMHLGPINKLFYLETGLIFMLIHSILYFRSIKKIV